MAATNSAGSATSQATILIVDDDAMFTLLMSARLSELGYACQTARSAAEARQLLNKPAIAAVVCDANLPGGGVELARDLHQQPDRLVTIVVSGLSRAELAKRGLPDDVLSAQKPVGAESLAALLGAAGVPPSASSHH